MEVWRDYPPCPSYQASSLGRIRSKDKVIHSKNGRSWFQKGRVLSPATNRLGRVSVRLSDHGRRFSVQVSHMVMESFVGKRADGICVRHLNDVSTDNRLENLAYGSFSDNSRDAIRNGKNKNKNKTHCKRGHEFTTWNTFENGKPQNRGCLACRRARSYINYEKNRGLDLQTVSDKYFEDLRRVNSDG